MKTRTLLALALAGLLVAVAGYAQAAESFTVSAVGNTDITDIGTGWANSFKVIKAEWKSNATTGAITVQTIPAHKGKVIMAVTNPGTEAPDDNYDIWIFDTQGVDIFGGALNNRDTANTEQAYPKIGTDAYAPRPIYGAMTFSMSGNTNTDANGELFLYLEE